MIVAPQNRQAAALRYSFGRTKELNHNPASRLYHSEVPTSTNGGNYPCTLCGNDVTNDDFTGSVCCETCLTSGGAHHDLDCSADPNRTTKKRTWTEFTAMYTSMYTSIEVTAHENMLHATMVRNLQQCCRTLHDSSELQLSMEAAQHRAAAADIHYEMELEDARYRDTTAHLEMELEDDLEDARHRDQALSNLRIAQAFRAWTHGDASSPSGSDTS